ncbi:MAG: adenosylcobinamide amidohydrolase [Anaerolineae bacterium]
MTGDISLELDFPGVTATLSSEALVLRSEKGLDTLASAVVGGGFTQTRCIVNRHVSRDYRQADPEGDLRSFAARHGIGVPFVGLMTAVYLDQTQWATRHVDGLTVAAVVTAGLSNPTSAGLSSPALLTPGTINIIVLVDGQLTPAALVNAVITVTEAKTHLLLERGLHTPEGFPATGTSTDAVVVASTGRGARLAYAGPATQIGCLIGQVVRQALGVALK